MTAPQPPRKVEEVLAAYAVLNVVYYVCAHILSLDDSNPFYTRIDRWQIGAIYFPAGVSIIATVLKSFRLWPISRRQLGVLLVAMSLFAIANYVICLSVEWLYA
jgi:hypothetical protein